MVYFGAANSLLASALTQNDAASWLSFLGYSLVAFGFWKSEYDHGTEAIRYLNNDYYLDEKLLPSVFYLLGLAKHKEKVTWNFESDPTQADDIPIDQFITNLDI